MPMVARSLQELRRWFDSCPAYVAVHEGPEHRYAYVNPAIERVLEGRRIIGKGVREVLTELVGDDLFERMDRTYRTGEISVENVMRLTVGSGSSFHRQGDVYFNHILQPWRNEEGEIQGIVSLAFDITRLVESREKLEQSREHFRIALKHAPITVFSQDRDLVYTWVFNASPEFQATQIIGKADRELLSPQDAEKIEALKRKVLQCRDVVHEEVSFMFCNSVHHFDLYLEALFDSEGEVVGVTGAAVEITARKQLAEQLSRMNLTLEDQVRERTAQLRQRMKQLRRLWSEVTVAEERERERLAEIIHDDLQQYLVAMRLGLERLQVQSDEVQLPEQISTLLSIAEDAMRVSRSLAADLPPRTLQADGLIPALEWLKIWLERNQKLVVELDLDSDAEPGDDFLRSLLYSAAKELLLNSVKHGDASEVGIELSNSGRSFELSICDNGRGFPEFSSEEGEKGTGLGLPAIRRRIESIGGQVQIRSVSGFGSRIDITVPKDNEE